MIYFYVELYEFWLGALLFLNLHMSANFLNPIVVGPNARKLVIYPELRLFSLAKLEHIELHISQRMLNEALGRHRLENITCLVQDKRLNINR